MDGQSPGTSASTVAGTAQRQLPLSFGQQQLWFLDQLAPGEPTYNVTLAFRLRGPVDPGLLRRALAVLVARHAALRASFGAVDGTPYQVLAPAGDVDLAITDLRGLGAAEADEAVRRELAAEMAAAFDLGSGPLYRFRLLARADDDHVLCLAIHHAVVDGWSTGILTGELSTVYQALAAGAEPALPELPAGYADFVAWQRDQLATGGFDDQLAYWAERLADLPVLELPADRRRPATPTFRGDSVDVDYPAALAAGLRAAGERHGASLFMLLATAVNVVASRYTGQQDIPLGISVLGRPEPEHEPVVGLFTNMVVLRTDLSGDPTLGEIVERVADETFDVQENQDVPFDKVVERIQPVRDASWNPLFQVSMQLLGAANAGTGFTLPGVTSEALRLTKVRSRFDLTMTFLERPDGLGLHLEYSTDLFDRWRIEAFARHVGAALAAIAADPSVRLSQVPLLSTVEQAELFGYGRGELVDYPHEPVHVRIAAYAAAHPEAVAAEYAGTPLTYGELDRRAGRLASWLRARGVGPEQVVAVVVERDLDALVGLVGVLKAGAAFAVLDPANPAGRLEFMLRDTAAPVLLTQSRLLDRLPADGWATLCLDTQWAEVEAAGGGALPELSTRDSLAYVLYTSGSTGRPKGVLIEHRALSSFVAAYQRTFDLGPGDRMLQLAALSFDMSQGEIFTGLSVGATLVLVPKDVGASPDALGALIGSAAVSYVCLSPAMLSLLEAGPYPELRKIMVGGEACPAEIVNKWNLPGRRMVNVYGPTEAAVGCTEHVCEHKVWESAPPIGRPHLERQLYVVDRASNLVPVGVPGELLIGGTEGLARGYLNQSEQTAERFVADPFQPDQRVYRSGDLVIWNRDGELEFLGRLDSQVKLHGLRIELEEIEAALVAHPAVATAVVLLRPDAGGDNRLVGYVVPVDAAAPPAPAGLREHLAARLPAYMVPSAWVFLEKFPLTSARKVNRAALPDPAPDGAAAGGPAQPAATPTEAKVAEIFAEVLALPAVDAGTGFFELGGDSLRAMRAISRLNKAFGVKVNVRTLYRSAQVRAIAAVIDELAAKARG